MKQTVRVTVMICMYTHIGVDVDVIGRKISFYEIGRLIDRLLNSLSVIAVSPDKSNKTSFRFRLLAY